jgi:hypothetical protein
MQFVIAHGKDIVDARGKAKSQKEIGTCIWRSSGGHAV